MLRILKGLYASASWLWKARAKARPQSEPSKPLATRSSLGDKSPEVKGAEEFVSLKNLLAERGIKCAHIIDDAYDKVPTYAMAPEEAQHVLEVIDDATLNLICSILGLKNGDEDGLRARLQVVGDVQTLFKRRNEIVGDAATALFDSFDKDVQGKLTQLKPLVEVLERNGVKCQFFGGDYQVNGSDEPQLFFVDLKLKEGAGDVPRHEDAVQVYEKLQTAHPGCKPFVFLMSSLSLVLGDKREPFRRDADLFQSEFEDIDKAAFTNGDELARILGSFTRSMPQLAALRKSMNEVELAVGEASQSVMKELRALDLADYFVLYHNTTSVEKITLGSYVVEMLLEFLSHEVEGQDRVWGLAKALDGLNVQELPRARFGLTRAAAKLYSANMLHSQEMLLAEDAMQHGPSHGFFFTGDIFFDAQSLNLPVPSRALAVITPACDLVRPEQLKNRSILLCEGSVREMVPSALVASDSLPLVVMQHPRASERFLAIEWDKKKLLVWDAEDRAKFADATQCSFVRVGRLRPVYALQLQHAVTSDLSRVGTQKPPSSLVAHGLKCFVSDGTKWHEIYVDAHPDAAALSESVIGGKKYLVYVLSDAAVHKALVMLASWIAVNGNVKGKATLVRVLGDDAREAIRGHKQRVPEKAAKPGKQLDVSAYPMVGKWQGNEAKAIALVRGVNCASPYAQLSDGHDVRGDQDACFVFRLEKASGTELDVPDEAGEVSGDAALTA